MKNPNPNAPVVRDFGAPYGEANWLEYDTSVEDDDDPTECFEELADESDYLDPEFEEIQRALANEKRVPQDDSETMTAALQRRHWR